GGSTRHCRPLSDRAEDGVRGKCCDIEQRVGDSDRQSVSSVGGLSSETQGADGSIVASLAEAIGGDQPGVVPRGGFALERPLDPRTARKARHALRDWPHSQYLDVPAGI